MQLGYRPRMPSDPHVVWMPGHVRTEIHLVADDTGNAFCLLADEPPAGWSLPAHRHINAAETIHIVEGDFEMEVDGQQSRMSAGDTIHVPQGVIHSGTNVGGHLSRRVVLFSPAGMERFFLEAGAPGPNSDTDLAAALAAATRNGWEFIS